MADITTGLLVVYGCRAGLPLAIPGLGLPVCTVWYSYFSVGASTFPSQELYKLCLTIHFMRDSSMNSLCLLGW